MARSVGGLVDLVHGLGLPVIAEGVETSGEAVHLDGPAVEHQRGFLHSRPLPADALERLWREQPETVPH